MEGQEGSHEGVLGTARDAVHHDLRAPRESCKAQRVFFGGALIRPCCDICQRSLPASNGTKITANQGGVGQRTRSTSCNSSSVSVLLGRFSWILPEWDRVRAGLWHKHFFWTYPSWPCSLSPPAYSQAAPRLMSFVLGSSARRDTDESNCWVTSELPRSFYSARFRKCNLPTCVVEYFVDNFNPEQSKAK